METSPYRHMSIAFRHYFLRILLPIVVIANYKHSTRTQENHEAKVFVLSKRKRERERERER